MESHFETGLSLDPARMNFLAISLVRLRRDRHRFLGEGIEVVFWHAVLQNPAIGSGELLHGFKTSGQANRGVCRFKIISLPPQADSPHPCRPSAELPRWTEAVAAAWPPRLANPRNLRDNNNLPSLSGRQSGKDSVQLC